MSKYIEVSKQIDFCYGHRLLDYQGPCANLHGHTGTAEIVLRTPQPSDHPNVEHLDSLGLLVDFSEIKLKAKAWIDTNWDHAMLLNSSDEAIINLVKSQGLKHYVMPGGMNPTSENMAAVLFNVCESLFMGNQVAVHRVSIFEGPSSSATVQQA